jgi:hypothetical protein
MIKSNRSEVEQETGGPVVLFIYRRPKKNRDAMMMMRVNKQQSVVDLFRKFGVRLEPFQLTGI